MRKRLFAATALALLFTQAGQAATFNPQPENCPTAAAIQAVGVSRNVVQDDDGLWLTGRRDQKYKTKNSWTFIIGKIPAKNASQAYDRAAVAMKSLNFQLGPLNGPLGKWICYYSTAQGYTAITINPPIAYDNNSAIFLKR